MNSSGRTGARAAHGHRAGACSFSLVRDTKQYDSEESSSGRLFFYAFFGEEDQRRQEKTTGTLLSSMVMAVRIIGKVKALRFSQREQGIVGMKLWALEMSDEEQEQLEQRFPETF